MDVVTLVVSLVASGSAAASSTTSRVAQRTVQRRHHTHRVRPAAAAARLNAAQVTTPLASEPEFVASTNVTPPGSVSASVTSVRSLGPAFDVVMT